MGGYVYKISNFFGKMCCGENPVI